MRPCSREWQAAAIEAYEHQRPELRSEAREILKMKGYVGDPQGTAAWLSEFLGPMFAWRFFISRKRVSRGKSQSATAKAAYNAREQLRDERTGEMKDYARVGEVVFSGIFAPKDAPA